MRPLKRRRLRRRRVLRNWRRAGWWIGLPLAAVLVSGAVAFHGVLLGEPAIAVAEDGLLNASAALGLVVTDIEVVGRTTTPRQTILAMLAAHRGTPILSVGIERAEKRLEALPWVRAAVVERRLPGTLYVRLVERKPLALWQNDGALRLIDSQGEIIPVKDLAPFARLPLVVGHGAPSHAAALIDMLASVPTLAARVTAAIRIGDRRWNLQIDNSIEVMLPEKDPAEAWARLARLDRTSQLLKRDVQSVDMRLPDRLVLRVDSAAAKASSTAEKGRPSADRI